jgi:hypothetical protein
VRIVDQLGWGHFRGDLQKRIQHLLLHFGDRVATGRIEEDALAGERDGLFGEICAVKPTDEFKLRRESNWKRLASQRTSRDEIGQGRLGLFSR